MHISPEAPHLLTLPHLYCTHLYYPYDPHPPTQAFMKLSLIREKFEDLVRVVEETGRLENDGRDLENRSEQLRARNTALNTERVVKDLRQVKEENAGLKARLKAL